MPIERRSRSITSPMPGMMRTACGARNDASLHPKVASANVPGGLTGLYVVWEEYNQIDLEDTASRREVYFARSFDWGQTWEIVGRSGHTYLYDPADDCTTVRDAFNLAIAADDAGRVVVVWETMCTHQDVVYHHVRSAFSEDHGATWSGTSFRLSETATNTPLSPSSTVSR